MITSRTQMEGGAEMANVFHIYTYENVTLDEYDEQEKPSAIVNCFRMSFDDYCRSQSGRRCGNVMSRYATAVSHVAHQIQHELSVRLTVCLRNS